MHQSAQPADSIRATARPVSPRRLNSIRRLLLVGFGLFVMISVIDFFVPQATPGLTLSIRSVFSLAMLGLWLLSRKVKTSRPMFALVCTDLALIATGASLHIYLDPTRSGTSLNFVILLVMVSGQYHPDIRKFAAGALACVLPPLLSLAIVDAKPTVWVDFLVYLGIAVVCAAALWQHRIHAARASAELRVELERRAVCDALTGVLNRAGWSKQAETTLAAADESGRPVSLLYLDLDHFKTVNDRHGHSVGDAVIEQAAQLIRSEVRQHELVARMGGEEFAVLLVDAGLMHADAVAERIRAEFERNDEPVPGTLCVGVAERMPQEGLSALMARADAALLQAKRNGRNRIEHALLPS